MGRTTTFFCYYHSYWSIFLPPTKHPFRFFFLQYTGIYLRWIDKLNYVAYSHLIGSYSRQKQLALKSAYVLAIFSYKIPICTERMIWKNEAHINYFLFIFYYFSTKNTPQAHLNWFKPFLHRMHVPEHTPTNQDYFWQKASLPQLIWTIVWQKVHPNWYDFSKTKSTP